MIDESIHREAMRAALRARRQAGVSDDTPLDVWDTANRLRVPVRFLDAPGLEGLYTRSPTPLILVAACRPPGRQAFTCAHELGHHVFGHGGAVDEMIAGDANEIDQSPEEQLANAFAGHLLMPPRAVQAAISARRLTAATLGPADCYALSEYFGVSYDAFVVHAGISLRLFPYSHTTFLRAASLPGIRQGIIGTRTADRVVPVDTHWLGRSIDLRIGDYAVLPAGSVTEGSVAEHVGEVDKRILVRATKVGIGRAESTPWAAYIRVCKPGFSGLAKFRYWPEVDDD